jgi:hypothetical protein
MNRGGASMLEELIRSVEILNETFSERIKVYEASYSFKLNNAPKYDYFFQILTAISYRDVIKITLQDENDRIFEFSSLDVKGEKEYNSYLLETLDDEIIDVRIHIDKNIKEDHFSIYSYKEFVNDLLSLSLEEVLVAFSNLLKGTSKYLYFDIYDTCEIFMTKTMFFIPNDKKNFTTDFFDRKLRLDKCKDTSYFYNLDRYELLPDDFKITVNYTNNPLTRIFQKLSMILSISFIASSAEIKKSKLTGIVNGQRSIEYVCDIEKVNDNNTFYKIYDWIYTDGNAIDKAIITRNVISLHCKYTSIMELDDTVIASIQSNYKLYLKNNVKEYLELKNKVAEFINNTLAKTGEYATALLDKFKSNLIAIFGFLFSVILANIVSDQPLDNIFTRQITVLMESVVLGSFVYLCICYGQFRFEVKKVYESYEYLKANYESILTVEDIREIFNNDKMLTTMKETIKRSEIFFVSVWIISLIGAIFVIEYLSNAPTSPIVKDLFLKIVK